MTDTEVYEIIEGFKNGKTIEYKDINDVWVTFECKGLCDLILNLIGTVSYRVKPVQPRIYRIEPYTEKEILDYIDLFNKDTVLLNANTELKCESIRHLMGLLVNNTPIKIKEEPKKTYWSKPEDVPVGGVITGQNGNIHVLGFPTFQRIYVVSVAGVGCISYGHLEERRWRFPHELKESDWKECTIESLEKYK